MIEPEHREPLEKMGQESRRYKVALQLTCNGDTVTARPVWDGPSPRSNPPALTETQLEAADNAARLLLGAGPGDLLAENRGRSIVYSRPSRKGRVL